MLFFFFFVTETRKGFEFIILFSLKYGKTLSGFSTRDEYL